MKIAFIGLGKMGEPMARSLLQAGHQVVVYNRTRAKAEALAAGGALIADSPGAAARTCDIAVTMLSDDDAVRHSALGDDGISSSLTEGAVHIGSSTISTALARHLTAEHAARNQRYVSAPVFGRPDAASAGKLLVAAAGEPSVLDRCRPVFDGVGRQTFIAGSEPWQANAVKLCGNFMIASLIECFGEANATLRKANVSPHLFLDVMNALFASPVYANYGRLIADEQFDPAGFALKLGLKDVRLALETAQECAAPMPFASVLRDHFLSAIALGYADSDWSRLSQIPAREAGL